MRPGLRSKPTDIDEPPPVSTLCSSDASDSQENYQPSDQPSPRPRGQNSRSRRGGYTGSQSRQPKQKRSRQDGPEPIHDSDEAHQHRAPTSPPLDESVTDTDATTPNMNNYHELGLKWGLPYAEKRLSQLSLPKNNRPSASGIFEAQALQAAYNLDKTMLCIVLKCSRHVLDAALLEGPLAREPNMYTNYQTYSVAANANKERTESFSPEVFEYLCVTTSEAYALTQTPLGISDTQTAETSNVNVPKKTNISQRGTASTPQSGTANQARDQQGGTAIPVSDEPCAINKLHVLNHQLDLEFHILLACWNPNSPTSKALFQDEYTSCARWARQQKKSHLLECFSFESTKAPEYLRPKHGEAKAISKAGLQQTLKRTPFLRGGVQGQGDAHPKVANVKEAFGKKTYRGQVALTFHRTPDSQVNEDMIAKGPSRLTNDEVQIWLDDIASKRYTIILDDTRKLGKRKGKLDQKLTKEEMELDDNPLAPEIDNNNTDL
ncbi:uncharacterized protein MELLADRAFT_87771 [Melampsora larici-populina 98AG31]|uniref:Uncharacterized protein n=1 Tax=Melampsora larici-populina (strain 98AG31 / pathotype 3-4-7) TaxID=747676 RepID=F4SDZ8_MELLP|nr:uncharacterized protein MELLADRAFT_87771 [Melampsora larici-populina 98AG31]EGF97131.1 hypothetical protein MELLADRAFT_87771 [Melampsora larici-populina 98AG31]